MSFPRKEFRNKTGQPANAKTNHSDESGFIDCSISSISSDLKNTEKEIEEQIEINKRFMALLPPAKALPKKQYSLEPDMIFGWRPKIHFYGPITLKFEDSLNNYLFTELYRNPNPSYKLIYLGFRPKDSFILHDTYSKEETYQFSQINLFREKYNDILQYLKKDDQFSFLNQNGLNTNRLFLGMNPKLIEENHLIFDSQFESGNLDAVVKINDNEYDCFMRVDSNTRGHLQWYFFSVKNKEKTIVKFNISNFTKKNSLYLRGMKPYVYSSKKMERLGIGWLQTGEKVEYKPRKLLYEDLLNNFFTTKKYFVASFEYDFEYEDDMVYFAYCIPYTYTMLLSFLKELSANDKKPLHHNKENKNINITKLCSTLSGIDVPLLTITEANEPKSIIDNRKVVIITGRVHPGETNGSWMMQGLIEYLAGDSKDSIELRRKCIFKIIPMLNPDGVILGNYRTNFAGKDLNRQFKHTNKVLFPTVFATKELIAQCKNQYGDNLIAFFDLHGHSIKRNVFIYGPDYPTNKREYYISRFIPKLLDHKTEMFRFYSSSFKISASKMSTSRAICFYDYKIKNCYTVEASFGNYMTKIKEIIPFNTELFKKMGFYIGEAIYDYYYLMDEFNNSLTKKEEQEKYFLITQKNLYANSDNDKSNIKETTEETELKTTNLEKKNIQTKKEKNQNDQKTHKNFIIKKRKTIKKNTKNIKPDEFKEYFKEIIEEIDKEENSKYNEHQSDEFEEGRSDSESSSDDLETQQYSSLQTHLTKAVDYYSKLLKDPKLFDQIWSVKYRIKQANKKPGTAKDAYMKKKIHSTQAIEQSSPLLMQDDSEFLNKGPYFLKNDKEKTRKPKEPNVRSCLTMQNKILHAKSQEYKIEPASFKDKKKILNPIISTNINNEMNINYINLNYVHENQPENNNNANNLAYMRNISNLMKKIELNKSKNKNQYPFKYYNKKEMPEKIIDKRENLFAEDSKKEIKSYQYVLNIEERKLDPEDYIDVKKKRNSSIPAGYHLMQKQVKIKKKANELKMPSEKYIEN